MTCAKIAISVDRNLLGLVDSLVQSGQFRSRSELFQIAAKNHVAGSLKLKLEQECEKLDPRDEQALADSGLETELDEWPVF